MKNIDFGFVILHYKAYEMTKICVQQVLLLYRDKNIKIIIVDNGSGNGSGEKLQKLYLKNDKVKVILNKKNLGFAKGNNIGFDYLKQNYHCKYMIVMNNDILLQDSLMLDKVSKIDKDLGFDVLGPDIYSLVEDNHQNPLRKEGYTTKQVADLLKHHEKIKKIYPFYYWRKKAFKVNAKRPKDNDFDRSQYIDNPVLHGAIYIFGSRFILNRDYAFNPRTFLYSEEDILYVECKRNHYKMLYTPDIQAIHLEHFSTNASFSSDYKKSKYVNNESIKSLRVLLDEMKKN